MVILQKYSIAMNCYIRRQSFHIGCFKNCTEKNTKLFLQNRLIFARTPARDMKGDKRKN